MMVFRSAKKKFIFKATQRADGADRCLEFGLIAWKGGDRG